jgi:hypothetical protein
MLTVNTFEVVLEVISSLQISCMVSRPATNIQNS